MTSIATEIGRIQLDWLSEFLSARREHAARYDRVLSVPVHPSLSQHQVETVATSLEAYDPEDA